MIQIYNTLAGAKVPLEPVVPGLVSIYVCGPTPYAQAHIGHARPAIIWDVIKRHLRVRGLLVHHIQNFTDIDDKLILRAREEGTSVEKLANSHIAAYFEALSHLGVEPADVYPKVTGHIPEIIAFIKGLLDKGFAYASAGDVYFSVERKPDYGKLSHRSVDELMQGVRVELAETKRAPQDFALWKASNSDEPGWPSPWGRGRPGWHIECSAMSQRYLGDRFDLHGGGVDLVFPHHENEIAQSEALTGVCPANVWVHNGLVTIGDVKMSKSLGNGIELDDLLTRWPGHVLRTYLLSVHYRTPLAFSDQGLGDWAKGLERIGRLWEDVASATYATGLPQNAAARELWEFPERFSACLDDDFNTARAFAELFDMVHLGFRTLDGAAAEEAPSLRALVARNLRWANQVLGMLPPAGAGTPLAAAAAGDEAQWLAILQGVRDEARRLRDFALADYIRERLQGAGYQVEDTPQGTVLRKKPATATQR